MENFELVAKEVNEMKMNRTKMEKHI